MQQFAKVIKSYRDGDFDRVIETLEPLSDKGRLKDASMLALLAQSFYKSDRVAQAAAYYVMAGNIRSPQSATYFRLAFELFKRLSMAEEGIEAAFKLLSIDLQHREAALYLRHFVHYFLTLDLLEGTNRLWLDALRKGDPMIASTDIPLNHISWCADEAINARMTLMQDYTAYFPAVRAERRARPHVFGDRIKVGYLSSDVSDFHATMVLLQGVLERHDRDRFEITLYCYTPDDLRDADTHFRRRWADRMVDIRAMSDVEAAERIVRDAPDIVVDLKGPTLHARSSLINMGLAPIQVAFLGFPGSGLGIDCDYVIADRIVTPDTSKPFYHEKLCRLPESYQPNDSDFRPLPPAATRAELGLPQDKIVFASFNLTRKISTETFKAWIAILKAVDESVLWMICDDPASRRNFLKAVTKQGIDEKRIVFADRMLQTPHLARLQAADIGLDTFPYNGHTTTSDKLWAGLPVVTKKGTHFASRVSESLLTALGVPDLVADDEAGYVRLAVELAREAGRRRALADRIVAQRHVAPLFDTARYTRHLEMAFAAMVDRARQGLEPDHIDIEPLPPRMR